MTLWQRIKSVVSVISPSCREASQAQSELLDGALPAHRRVGLMLHLLVCKWCRRYGKQLRLLRQAAHDHPDALTEAHPQNLSEAARNRIKQKLGGGA